MILDKMYTSTWTANSMQGVIIWLVYYHLAIPHSYFREILIGNWFFSCYAICNKGVCAIARKMEEIKDRGKPPSEGGVYVCVRYNFAGYGKGYLFLALRLIVATQNTWGRMDTMAWLQDNCCEGDIIRQSTSVSIYNFLNKCDNNRHDGKHRMRL